MALQLRRGTDAERQSITPKEGELIYATDTNRLWVGGKIAPNQSLEQGGILVSGSLVNDTNPTLAENLDLNGNDITGNGNININGTITATGTVNLGDGVEDNVVVGGQIGSSLIPGTDKSYDLGASASIWRNIYTSTIDADTSVNAGDIYIKGNIGKDDSTIIYDGATDALSVGSVTATGNITAASADIAAITGNLTGSVFGDDSTLLVDGVNNTLHTDSLSIDGERILGSRAVSTYDSDYDGLEDVVVIGSREAPGALVVEGEYNPLTVQGEASATQGSTITTQGSRFTGTTKTAIENGDYLGQYVISGYNGAEMKKTGIIASVAETAISSGNFGAKLAISVLNQDGLYREFAFNSSGTFNAGLGIELYNASDVELSAFGNTESTIGYASDRNTLVVNDGSGFRTVTTTVGVPSGPTATGKAGQVSGDANYMYFCHSDDNWIRVAKDGTWT